MRDLSLVTHHLRNVRFVVDSPTGVIAQRLDYDEFGTVLKDTNPGFQPFGFAGGLYDRDTGLIVLSYRHERTPRNLDYDNTYSRLVLTWSKATPRLPPRMI